MVFLCQNNQNSKQVKGGTITIQEFDTQSEIENSLSEDSFMYHEVAHSYGNYWETGLVLKLKEWHLIAIQGLYRFMKMIKKYTFDKNNPNLVFQWEFNNSNPNLIKGIHGWKENYYVLDI